MTDDRDENKLIAQRRQATASELGISRVTLYNKMKKFGMLASATDGETPSGSTVS